MQLRFLNTFWLLLAVGVLWGQESVQVVTKRIEKSFTYRETYELNIEGDRAEVFIIPSLGNEINIKIDLIAKHPDKSVAEKDVEKMAYIVKRVKNKIYLRNYLSIEAPENKPESKLIAIYNIQVPADCPVYVKNTYGIAEVSNLTNSVRINSKFSRIGLQNIKGTVDIQSRFGDLFGQSINGNVHIGSRRSNITLQDIQGTFDIDAQYGLIQIFASQGLLDLNLVAEKSQVMLYNTDLQAFRYDLTTVGTPINYPDDLNFKMVENKPDIQRVTYVPTNEFYPSITVKVTFGDLQIRQQAKKKRP